MNCPGHILIYKSRLRSYRELPVRLAELGTVYRYERSRRAARLDARARLHAGRRAHFLHARANRKGSAGLRRIRLGSAARLRIRQIRSRAFRRRPVASAGLRRHSRRVETRGGRAHHHAEAHERSLQIHSRRSRVLRPEDRREARGRDRPPLAAHHRAVRFQFAAPLRSCNTSAKTARATNR